MKRSKGFTLIELLVVIGIIALLVSILMPALGKAKRLAQITVCASNLHQIAMGLNMYAVDNDDKYMAFAAHWASAACTPGGADLRNMLMEYVANEGEGLLFCPAARYPAANIGQKPGYMPWAGGTITPEDQRVWMKHFSKNGDDSYFIGYSIFAGLETDSGASWDWSESGNKSKTHPPLACGFSKDVIAADQNIALSDLLEDDLYTSNHSKGYNNYYNPGMDLTFVNSNAAYGDGHVENHQTLDRWVLRDSNPARWFMY